MKKILIFSVIFLSTIIYCTLAMSNEPNDIVGSWETKTGDMKLSECKITKVLFSNNKYKLTEKFVGLFSSAFGNGKVVTKVTFEKRIHEKFYVVGERDDPLFTLQYIGVDNSGVFKMYLSEDNKYIAIQTSIGTVGRYYRK